MAVTRAPAALALSAANVLDELQRATGAEQAEVVLAHEDGALTRWAENRIHQNVEEATLTVSLRVFRENRSATVLVQRLDRETLADALSEVRDRLQHGAVAGPRGIVELPGPHSPAPRPPVSNDATAGASAFERAAVAREAIDAVRGAGLSCAGKLRTGTFSLAVANSHGLRRETQATVAEFVVCAITDGSTAIVERSAGQLERIDAGALAREAVDRCQRTRDPGVCADGRYTVILEPAAVALWLFHLNFRSFGMFGGRAAAGGTSFVAAALGQQVASPRLTMRDDPTDAAVIDLAIDWEGAARLPTDIVVDGIARGVVHDSATAIGGSTGHATGALDSVGPAPQHLSIAPGDQSVAELIQGVKRGVYIRRLHGYVDPLSPSGGLMTGTTRDGAMLIEDGHLTRPVRNLRWGERIVDVLGRISGVSDERQACVTDELWYPSFVVAPYVRVEELALGHTQPPL